jgi:hypothetical protein
MDFSFSFFRKQGEGSRQVDRIIHSVVVSRNKVGSAKEVGWIPSHGAAAGRAEGFVPTEEETQAGAQKETQERVGNGRKRPFPELVLSVF